MKKLVLAMACVLSLGLLASCKQGVQDVNLQNQEKSEASEYYGSVTGTFAIQKVSTDGKSYEADTAAKDTLVGSDVWKFSKLSWTESSQTTDTNYKTYTLKAEFAYNSNATTTTEAESKSASIEIYEINGKFYYNDYAASPISTKRTEIKLTGTPADSEFTIETLGYITVNNKVWSTKDIKFKRAE